jgi:MFS family permease
MRTKPDLGFWKLWNLSFGFFGVQIAYALQSANVSRIFATIGADPHDLSYFWILPPLMGMIVQPIVGSLSDKTWTRFGRRLPYLIVGAVAAVIVMCLLPNAGSFGLTISGAILMGLIALMLLDTSINMAMQPFKMLVGDMVNEKQKGKAYSIQSFLCNAGSIVGFIFPFCLAWIGIESTAPEGVVPPSVAWSFYIGAAILILCVIYSLAKIKEWPPQLYNEYNGIEEKAADADKPKEKTNLIKLLAKAPSTFWTVSAVQFFCWIAFLFMWTYTTGAIATKAFDTPTVDRVTGLTVTDASGNESSFSANYILVNDVLAVEKGKVVNEDAIKDLSGNVNITTASIFTKDKQTGKMVSEDSESKTIADPKGASFSTKKDLDTTSKEYNAAGDWVGILFAVQAVGSVIWAVLLPKLGSRKFSYALSLILGGIGFIMTAFISNQYLLFIPFLLIGCAWAAMLAWPFTIVTNSLKGGNIGTYLGLFNCSICLPQIVGALIGGHILSIFSVEGEVAPQYIMMIVAGVSLIIGSLCVNLIKEK